MPSRALRLGWVIILVASSVLTFLFLARFDASGIQGANHVLMVSPGTASVESRATYGRIEAVARSEGAVVARFQPDLRTPESRRHLFVAIGDPHLDAATWLRTGYPRFTNAMETVVQPMSALGQRDVAGRYLVFGPPEAGGALTTALREDGYQVTIDDAYRFDSLANFTLTDPVSTSVMVTGFLVFVLAAAGAILATRSYGVLRLQGQSLATMLRHDLHGQAAFAALAVSAGVVIVLGVLFLVNRWAYLGTYLGIAGCVMAGLTALMLVGHLGGVAWAHHRPLLSALKGDVASGGLLGLTWVVRALAALLTMTMLGAAVASWSVWNQYESTRTVWQDADDVVRLSFNPALGEEITEEFAQRAGEFLVHGEQDGMTLVVADQFLSQVSPSASGTPSLMVNGNYLRHQPHLLTDDSRADGPTRGEIILLIPENLADRAPAVLQDVQAWSEDMAKQRGIHAPHVTVRGLSPGQHSFTYGSQAAPDNPLVVTDAMLLVVDASSGLFPPDEYMSLASQGGVVLNGQDRTMQAVADSGLDRFVTGYSATSGGISSLLAEAARSQRIAAINVVAMLGVFLATTMTLAHVYVGHRRQRLFIQEVSGWHPLRTHGHLLITEGILIMVLLAIAATLRVGVPSAPPGFSVPHIDHTGTLVGAGLIILLLAGFLLILWTARQTRSVVANHAAEE